jgi:prepilin-type processing-associated H-X9-DG protein
VKVPFRWADVAVAASIFFAGLITLLPAVHRAQLQNDETVCTFNLGQIGRSLANYATTHGKYPYPSPNSPIPYAGVFKVMLHDSGHLVDPAILDCPSNGKAKRPQSIPNYDATLAMFKRSEEEFHHMVCGDYAYHLGVVQPTGEPGPLPAILNERLPIVSDQPGHDHKGHILEGNSPNHRGVGQNVLYTDGHVSWHSSRAVGPVDDDIFLNDRGQPAPGRSPQDAVLAPGCFSVNGRHIMGR